MKHSLLIISFSDISQDARVLKQVRALSKLYHVTTCGFGAEPLAGVEHLRVDVEPTPRRGVSRYFHAGMELISRRAGAWKWIYQHIPHVELAKDLLSGRTFDVVLANDVDTLPVALEVAGPAGIHADLHEFFPGIHDDSTAENRLQTSYLTWLVKKYATRATSATTVGWGIAEAYRAYGIECGVVTNATPRQNLTPGQVGSEIRLVHSGNAQPSRQLELIMEAAALSSANVTLDLLLMPNDVVYLAKLKSLADQLGPRVRVLDPLPQAELVQALNTYDIGVHVLPPTSFNNANALPNKFFDYVQARLGLIIGPSPEMARVLTQHGFGVVADDFTVTGITAAIDEITVETVVEWKSRSDGASAALSADVQIDVWISAIAELLHPNR